MANITDVKTYWEIKNVPQKWYSNNQTRNIFNTLFNIEIQGGKRYEGIKYKVCNIYVFLKSGLNLFRQSNLESTFVQNWPI